MTMVTESTRNGVDTATLSATLETVRAAHSRRRSAVYDVVTNGVPVVIEVDAG